MMKIIIFILAGCVTFSSLYANDHEQHDEHDDEHGHEENSQVAEDKGIRAASVEDGIKISPEAEKNFEIQKVSGSNIPKSAIVKVGEEINIYRYRDGFYKRIDFTVVKKDGDKIHVQSPDLKSTDQIVVQGMGYIRIVEIAAFGGAVTGHSH
jgi:hypothetical protein